MKPSSFQWWPIFRRTLSRGIIFLDYFLEALLAGFCQPIKFLGEQLSESQNYSFWSRNPLGILRPKQDICFCHLRKI